MVKGNTILFWFREELCLRDIELYEYATGNNADIIPVFCFDPREEIFSNKNVQTPELNFQIPEGIAAFCEKLHEQGTHVVLFHDSVEKVIPSLARVLSARKVLTGALLLPEKSISPALTEFKNQKVLEVASILNLHSISLEFLPPNSFPPNWHDIYANNKQVQG